MSNAKQPELDGIPLPPKKRGRPASGNAKTGAQRIAEHRARMRSAVFDVDITEKTISALLFDLDFFTKRFDAEPQNRENLSACISVTLQELGKRYCKWT